MRRKLFSAGALGAFALTLIGTFAHAHSKQGNYWLYSNGDAVVGTARCTLDNDNNCAFEYNADGERTGNVIKGDRY
ncbi:hypothetical protein SAMN05216436_12025 [bacterium A37T11]|nr:hypothetical protein SAMN05216436_12025 [bacterium A37T11]